MELKQSQLTIIKRALEFDVIHDTARLQCRAKHKS